jgi:hypothetical protein
MGNIVRYLRPDNFADLAGLFELAIGAVWLIGYFVFAGEIAVKAQSRKPSLPRPRGSTRKNMARTSHFCVILHLMMAGTGC